MATRWGIVGIGKIAADFAACIQSFDSDVHKIVAVASRSIERAQKFGAEFSVSQAYGSYEELSKDPNVEIAYVSTDHFDHFKCVKLMLEAGKHVLCEKPMCTSVKQVDELIKLAKANKRFLMEGIWSRFFPIYSHVQSILNHNSLGKALQVHANFGLQSFLSDAVSREDKLRSVTLDIGVYVLQICNLAFKNTKPKILLASGSFDKNGADDSVVMLLDYGQGRIANVTISWKCFFENSAVIACEKSYIKILPPFHCPTQVEVDGGAIEFKLPKIDHKFNYENSAGFVYEIEEVRRCLQNGLLESPAITLQESKDIATVLQDVRNSIGINVE